MRPTAGQKQSKPKKAGKKNAAKPRLKFYQDDNPASDIRMTIALVLVARRWRSLMDEHLRPLSQSSARMEALSAIVNSPDPSSQIDVANRLRIEGPTMTRMIDVLSRDGLVERRPAPADRRTKHLSVTKAGQRELEETFKVADELRTRLLDGLSDEQIETMSEVLTLMLERLDAGLPEPNQDEKE